jgi:hypothetical protein
MKFIGMRACLAHLPLKSKSETDLTERLGVHVASTEITTIYMRRRIKEVELNDYAVCALATEGSNSTEYIYEFVKDPEEAREAIQRLAPLLEED